MRFLERFRKSLQPTHPDFKYAVMGFTPVMGARIGKLDIDLYEMADDIADGMLRSGVPFPLATSARWGGVTAIGQDLDLYASFLGSYDKVSADLGRQVITKGEKLAKYNAASIAMITLVMEDAPNEYERFLKYIGVHGTAGR